MKLRTVLFGALALLTAVLVAKAQVPGVNSTLQSVFTLVYDSSTMKPTYSSTMTFAPLTSGGSGTTDVCQLVGSSTRTVKVRRVLFSMVATTAVTDPIALVKRSTTTQAGAGGNWIVTPTSYDSANTATATADVFTTNPASLGTLVGVIADPLFSVGNLTTGGAQTLFSRYEFGIGGSPIVLRGTSQTLAINFNAYQYAGNIANCTFEWTEDADS